jgi:hypothetical protein
MSKNTLTCRKCGETFQKGVDLSLHYRVVHTGPLQLGLADRTDNTTPDHDH